MIILEFEVLEKKPRETNEREMYELRENEIMRCYLKGILEREREERQREKREGMPNAG